MMSYDSRPPRCGCDELVQLQVSAEDERVLMVRDAADGARTLTQAAEWLEQYAARLRALGWAGYELTGPVVGGVGRCAKTHSFHA